MCYDIAETTAYYKFQLDHGKWDEHGGRTNLDHVCALVRKIRGSNLQILDLGCGDGDVAQAIRDRCMIWSRYVGVDAFADVIRAFRNRKLDDVELFVRKVSDFAESLRGESVDLVLCLFLLQDLCHEEGAELIKQTRRVLKPGGHAIWAVAAAMQATSFENRGAAEDLKKLGSPQKWRFTWSETELRDALQSEGLRFVDERRQPNPTRPHLSELFLLTRRVE